MVVIGGSKPLDLGQLEVEIPSDADGPYWLIYQADIEEQVPDHDRSNNTRAVPIYIDGPHQPELAIDRFDSPGSAVSGGSVLIDYEVRNVGQGWANSHDADTPASSLNWTDRVYLSADRTLDETDLELRSFERLTSLGPDETYRHERVELALPRGITGRQYLITVCDADQQLDQPSFTAGLIVKPIDLIDSDAPDLVVATITHPSRLVIGQPAPVALSVANLGSVPTLGSAWVDGFYLSRGPELDGTAVRLTQVDAGQPLQPRSRYESDALITAPLSIEPGDWYLIAKADSDNAVDEAVFEDNNTLAVPIKVLTPEQAQQDTPLGDPDRPERLVVQWIEHDRLEQHVARLSRTVQPALQDKADPVPDAPLIFDPTPPTIAQRDNPAAGDPSATLRPKDPTDQQDARPRPAPADASQTDRTPRPQTPGTQPPQRIDGLPGTEGDANPLRPGIDRPAPPVTPAPIDPTPSDDQKPTPTPGEKLIPTPPDPAAPDTDQPTRSETPSDKTTDTDGDNPNDTDTKQPTEQLNDPLTTDPAKTTDVDQPSRQDGQGDADEKDKNPTTPKPDTQTTPKPDGEQGDPATPSEAETPTRAPRDDSEAPPTINRITDLALQEGKVLVGKGIKVTTKLPIRPGTGASKLSLPRNARVRVVFNKDGRVHEAKILRSTTYAEWDTAIEASLYRWSARGQAIDKADPHVAIEWNYLLNDLFGDDED